MKTYTIDPATGQACPPAAPGAISLHVLSRDEFAACQDSLPHRGNLLRDLGADPLRGCRAERYASCVLGTLTSAPLATAEGGAIPMFGFYLSGRSLYLVDGGPLLADALNRVRQTLPENIAAGDILRALMGQLLEKEADRLFRLSETLDGLEERLMTHVPQDFYPHLLRYQRMLSRLHTYYQQLADVGEALDDAARAAGEDTVDTWQRYIARATRLHDHAETLREHLVQLRELYQAQVSAAQNRTITLLTVVTSLFAPLTLLTGWYGMNFAAMPELRSPYGYGAVIAAAVGIVLIELLWFRHKKML